MLVLQLLLLGVLSVCLWWGFIAILGFCKREPARSNTASPHQHFAVIICAHNEATVIDQVLLSLEQQDYPTDCYHCFVLADHCTDATAERARTHSNVTVYERTEGERSGKGAVLEWGLQKLLAEHPQDYEAFVLFDADNTMAADFLSVMDRALDQDTAIVTGQRLSQNPFASIISQWYTIYWGMMNTLCNTPRYRLGLSSMLSGTGFAFKLSALENKQWRTQTFIEDVEFDFQQTIKGNTVQYAEAALFYDEQPTTFDVMFKQLSRWCTGGVQILRIYLGQWCRLFWQRPSWQLVDSLFFITMCNIVGLSLVVNVLLNLTLLWQGSWLFILNSLLLLCGFTLLTIFVGFISTLKVHWPTYRLLPGILTFPLFFVLFSFISVYSFLLPQKEWKKIEHVGAASPRKEK